MIESLTIRNFLSFKEEVTFSFEADREKRLEDYHIVEIENGKRLLKLGIIYGANASGKSNLLEAFEFLGMFWGMIHKSKENKIGVVPFRLDHISSKEPSYFNLVFYFKGIKYAYTLEIKDQIVTKEILDFYPGVQPANIFTRTYNDKVSKISFGAKIKISDLAKQEIELKCLPNMSVFAAYKQVNVNLQETENVLEWIKKHFMGVINPDMDLSRFAKELLYKDKETKSEVLSFLKEADFNISDIQIEKEKKSSPEFESFISKIAEKEGLSENEKDQIRDDIGTSFKAEFIHQVSIEGKEEHFLFPEKYESDGTMRILGLSTLITRALKNDAFLCIDELESRLHPELLSFVLKEFLKKSKNSQLLVTTHYDALLEETDIFRKDNFWFTEKAESGTSDLFSLTEFKGLNRITSLRKAYKKGSFGAIPDLD